jgi:hypothetical protein
MLRYVHFYTKGGLRTFAAGAKPDFDSRRSGPSTQRSYAGAAKAGLEAILLYPPMSVFALPSKLGDAFAK